MDKCFHPSKGLTTVYGIEHGCNLNETDCELCKKCHEYALQKSKEFFQKIEKHEK